MEVGVDSLRGRIVVWFDESLLFLTSGSPPANLGGFFNKGPHGHPLFDNVHYGGYDKHQDPLMYHGGWQYLTTFI